MSAKDTAEAFLIVVKRFAKWAMFGFVGLVAAGVLLWAGNSAYAWWAERPYKLTEYEGIKIGASQSEVKYAKGLPSNVLVDGTGELDWTVVDVSKLASGKSVEDYFMWSYAIRQNKRLDISFDRKLKTVSSITCYSESYFECQEIFGIRDGSTEIQLVDKLRAAEKEEITEATKRMDYAKYNVQFFLSKMNVYMIKVGSDNE